MAIATNYIFICFGHTWSFYYTTPSFIADPELKNAEYNTEESAIYMASWGRIALKARGGEIMMTDDPVSGNGGWADYNETGCQYVDFLDKDIVNIVVWQGGWVVASETELSWIDIRGRKA